jgi:ketosteroid isomerase-like protein
MGEQENTQLVKQAYENYKSGNISALLNLFSDDIEWELDETENVPFSGARSGKEQVAKFFDELNDAQHSLQFEPREFIAQGDKVVALGHYAWMVNSTDRTYESDWAEVFTIRNGKISKFREYANTAAGAAAYQKS